LAKKPKDSYLQWEGDDPWPVISADHYFTDVHGNYNWKVEDLCKAHAYSLEETENMMIDAEDKIFVANTFTRKRELKPYYELAEKYNYRVFSIIVENRHEGKNVHNVPDEALEKQRNRFNIEL